IRDPQINAFALPGGYIGVHSGLLLTAESESEFASVMGHEIDHGMQRHIDQMVGFQGRSMAVMIASLLNVAPATDQNPPLADSAIASVMGHGIAHVTLRHIA